MVALGFRGQTPGAGIGVLGTDPKYWQQTPSAGTGVQGRDPEWWHWGMGQGPQILTVGYRAGTPGGVTRVRGRETPNTGSRVRDSDPKCWH